MIEDVEGWNSSACILQRVVDSDNEELDHGGRGALYTVLLGIHRQNRRHPDSCRQKIDREEDLAKLYIPDENQEGHQRVHQPSQYLTLKGDEGV